MSASSLPERPDLDQIRRQAKELRDAARVGNAVARERIRAHLPGHGRVSLAMAQMVVAREHGFASWPTLKAEIEARTMHRAERVRAFLEASLRGPTQPVADERNVRAVQLLNADPGVATYDIRTAVVLGEVAQVRELLSREPALAIRPDPESGLPPLLFVCNSRWHWIDPRRAEGLLGVARMLLDAGADSDTAVGVVPQPGHCSALYAAAGLANHLALAKLLLERGADVDTPAALYHAAFHGDHECLRLLLDHGARAEGGEALAASISTGDVEAVRLLLDAGVDPRQRLGGALGEAYEDLPPVGAIYAAIEFHCTGELIELLLDHGADPNAPGRGGRSPYQLAIRHGRIDVSNLLLRHGARADATEVDRFLVACMRADRGQAARELDRHPELLERLTDEEIGILIQAADHGSTEAVRLMLDLGFPLDTRALDGCTPLHVAAFSGRADVVQLLIDRGADLEAVDAVPRRHTTPLRWAAVGSGLRGRYAPGAVGVYFRPDWVATVRTLLDAGASAEGDWTDQTRFSREVADLLHSYGITGQHQRAQDPGSGR